MRIDASLLAAVALSGILAGSLWFNAGRIADLERDQAATSAELRALETKWSHAQAQSQTQTPTQPGATPSAAAPACPTPISCEPIAEPAVPLEAAAAPNASHQERARADLSRRIAQSFDDGELSPDEQERAVALLLEIRRLRSLQLSTGLGAKIPPDQRDERDAFFDAQYELEALTRLSFGALIEKLDGRGGPPEPVAEGAVRKRFADEAARVLGVAEPGETEILRDGNWESEAR